MKYLLFIFLIVPYSLVCFSAPEDYELFVEGGAGLKYGDFVLFAVPKMTVPAVSSEGIATIHQITTAYSVDFGRNLAEGVSFVSPTVTDGETTYVRGQVVGEGFNGTFRIRTPWVKHSLDVTKTTRQQMVFTSEVVAYGNEYPVPIDQILIPNTDRSKELYEQARQLSEDFSDPRMMAHGNSCRSIFSL